MTETRSTAPAADVLDVPVALLDGTPGTARGIAGDRVALVVNVASRCGLTPQYAGLERLQERYADAGLVVVGVPCNQFGGQEPGSPEQIAEFCSSTYGVTFPLTAKVEVNGPGRDPIYAQLTETPDADGEAGDIQWNFEKFLLDGSGAVLARFRPRTEPDDPAVLERIDALLAG